ncbi:hypothetical protein INT45_011976, partial [Circinella minor]
DICINDYYITLDTSINKQLNNNDFNNNIDNNLITNNDSNSNNSNTILHDDHSLREALKSMSERHYLELILQRKRARTLSPPLFRRESLPMFPQQSSDDIPVIKPTVLRWSPASTVHPMEMRPSQFSYNNDNSSYSTRKDSGISFDEPIKKKQRVASVDDLRSRKLPDLCHHSYSSPPRRHHSLFDPTTITSSSTSSSSLNSVHPLELRRPSYPINNTNTHAPPSPPYPKLPAITSITHNMTPMMDQQQLLRSPPQTPSTPSLSYPFSASSPLPSRSTVTSLPPVVRHHSLPYKPHHQQEHTTINGRRPSAIKSSSKTPGQFLCEHVVDPTSQKICGQTFRRSYDLSRHQSIHMKNRPFCYCNHCGKKFTRMDALRRHERVQGHFTNSTRSHRFHTSAGQSV